MLISCTCLGHFEHRDHIVWVVDIPDPECTYPHQENPCVAS